MKHILTPQEHEHYPNLHKFWTRTGASCNGKTRIHHVEFHPDGPRYTRNIQLGDPDTDATQVFIIEQADIATLRYFWDSYVTEKHSFLQCLDDFFHDHPSFNFTDIRPKILQTPSVLAKQNHLTFNYVLARQFDKPMRLDYGMIQKAAKDFGTWRDDRDFGPMNPVQRRELGGEQTAFPPLALTRTSATAWFDSRHDRPWRTGLIFLDRHPKFWGLPCQLQVPFAIINGRYYGTIHTRSPADLLLACMQQNGTLNATAVPPPLVVVEDLYRLVTHEWAHLAAYFTRDLNAIEWALQRGGGDKGDVEHLRRAMRDLFFARRRMAHYCALIQHTAHSAAIQGRPVWCTALNATEAQWHATGATAADLQRDLAALEHVMTQMHLRLQSTMTHITAETTVMEADRARVQNKILLLLAVIGTIFLPVSSLAAVFSMGGDWAAGGSNFGWFWAICGPVEVVLLGLLLGVSYWDIISSP
ncbi:hypothetical protein CCM_06981 [Cordyceps militaris CM01]|uniref:Uncharacterized protein n=1 Tax=Cordyceps militaris (strain CM01) TaxID=983644 RepID=G3JLI7_CORMM|nr:uncharacterized protein CCM_06981 [Cordyceps militaris CM01]EGX90561.1 hypothetical protein CCM_06981 [Cordyceps militaris CM01]